MKPGRWSRKRVLLTLSIAAVLALLALFKFSPHRTVVLNWDYNYTHDPPCASPSAENCVRGFRVSVGDLSDHSQQLFVANPADASRNANQRLETTLKVDRFGYLRFCVLAVKNLRGGITVESVPLCRKRLVLPFAIGSHWAQ
jgi:hypothetical protein